MAGFSYVKSGLLFTFVSQMERLKSNEKLMTEFDSHGITQHYVAGQTISSKELNSIPILIHGMLKIHRVDKDGNKYLLYYVKPNETCVLTLIEGILNKDSRVTITVEEDSELFMIPADRASDWIHQYPEWAHFILDIYHQKFEEMVHLLDSLAGDNMEARLVRQLRYRGRLKGQNIIRLTHQQLAEDMASTRVVISRLLKNLEKQGLVNLGRNKIDISGLM